MIKIFILIVIALASVSYFYINPLANQGQNAENFSDENHKSFEQIDRNHANLIHEKLLKDLEKIPQSKRQLYEESKNNLELFIPPKDKKVNDTEYVLPWYAYVAPDIHTFTPENYIMRLTDFPVYFTENGFTQYLIIFDRAALSLLLDNQIQQGIKGYSIKSTALAKPELQASHIIDGIREWTLNVPIKMTFGVGSTSSTEVEIKALVKESSDTKNKYGLAIDDLTILSQ